ncbi:MAG: SIMPL domain-containing protein [Candidatus Micrarchaeota archaeon]
MAKEKEEICEHPLCDSGLRLALFFVLIILVGGVLVSVLSPRPVEIAISNVTATPPEHLIFAGGIAQTDVQPDELVLSLGAESQGETASASQSANAEAINAVKASLMANGIAEGGIQTSSYAVYPLTRSRKVCPAENPFCGDWEATWVDEITGYKTIHMLSVKSGNLDSAGALVDAAVRSGANRVDYVSFTLKDETRKAIEESLVAEAMADARGQAERIASGLGVSVGKVASASVGGIFVPEPRAFAMEAAGTSFSPGQLTVSVSASASFEIAE